MSNRKLGVPLTPKLKEEIRKILKRQDMPPESFEPPTRQPLAFGYQRCSHQDSADTRIGLNTQTHAIEAWYQVVKEEHGIEWGKIYEDAAVSATKKHFYERPEGGKLNRQLRRGDHVIFAKFDRAFRNTQDCIQTLDDWDRRGVIVHFADLKVDRSTAAGKFMIQIIAACAEMEAACISERNLACAAEQRRQGKPCSRHSPPGFKIAGPKGRRYYKPISDWDWRIERSIRQEVIRLKDEAEMSWREIEGEIEKNLAVYENRKAMNWANPKLKYKQGVIKKMYRQEKALQAFERDHTQEFKSLQSLLR